MSDRQAAFYICRGESGYAVSDNDGDAVLRVYAPCVEDECGNITEARVTRRGEYLTDALEISESVRAVDSELFELTRRVVNRTEEPVRFKLIQSICQNHFNMEISKCF